MLSRGAPFISLVLPSGMLSRLCSCTTMSQHVILSVIGSVIKGNIKFLKVRKVIGIHFQRVIPMLIGKWHISIGALDGSLLKTIVTHHRTSEQSCRMPAALTHQPWKKKLQQNTEEKNQSMVGIPLLMHFINFGHFQKFTTTIMTWWQVFDPH